MRVYDKRDKGLISVIETRYVIYKIYMHDDRRFDNLQMPNAVSKLDVHLHGKKSGRDKWVCVGRVLRNGEYILHFPEGIGNSSEELMNEICNLI